MLDGAAGAKAADSAGGKTGFAGVTRPFAADGINAEEEDEGIEEDAIGVRVFAALALPLDDRIPVSAWSTAMGDVGAAPHPVVAGMLCMATATSLVGFEEEAPAFSLRIEGVDGGKETICFVEVIL